MPCSRRGGEPQSRAHCPRVTRRHLLGASVALFASTVLPLSAHAAPAGPTHDSASVFDAASFPTAASYPTAADFPTRGLPLQWPPPPAPDNIVLVPFKSQLDGSRQARANCGPASLAMLLGYLGDDSSIASLRVSVDQYMGIWSVDNGATWEALAYAAQTRGFQVADLYAAPGKYRQWSVDDLAATTRAGNPVIILVRFRALPGRESSAYLYNHYILILGMDDDGSIVFHDPDFPDAATGSYLRMTRQQLIGAWSTVTSGIVYTGMVVKPKNA